MLRDRAWMSSGSALSIAASLWVAGCGGDDSGDRGASSGGKASTSSGGSTSASGGASSASGGSGPSGPGYACDAQPATAEISASIKPDGKWGDAAGFNGGTFTYGKTSTKATDPNDLALTYPAATIVVKGTVGTYAGFGLWFGLFTDQLYPCVDASAFSGVSFEIVDNTAAKTLTELTVSVQEHGDAAVDTVNKRGGCEFTDLTKRYSECVFPGAKVPVPAAGGVIEVPWSDFVGGLPVATTTGAELDGLQFSVPWAEGATVYDVDFTIKDLKFY